MLVAGKPNSCWQLVTQHINLISTCILLPTILALSQVSKNRDLSSPYPLIFTWNVFILSFICLNNILSL